MPLAWPHVYGKREAISGLLSCIHQDAKGPLQKLSGEGIATKGGPMCRMTSHQAIECGGVEVKVREKTTL